MKRRFIRTAPVAGAVCMLCSNMGVRAAVQEAENVVELQAIDVVAAQPYVPLPRDAKRLLPPAAGGQVASGSQVGVLGNLSNLDTPFNITGYTADYIANAQARSIADVAAADPSVRVIFPRASYRDAYSIRGFNLFSYTMGLDGLYGVAPKQRYPAEFAERIEILKGPDTFVNGVSLGGSVGGAINIIPKRATDEPVGTLTTLYESDRDVGTHVDLGRRFGASNEWGLRVNGLARGGDMAVDDQAERLGAAVISLDYQGEGIRLYADAGDQQQKIDAPDWPATLAKGVSSPPNVDADRNLGQSWTWVRTKDRYAALRGEYDLNEQWTTFTSLGISETETTGLYVQPTSLRSEGGYTGVIRSFPSNGEHLSGQAGLRGMFGSGPISHNLTLAATYWHQNLKATNTILGTYTADIDNPATVIKPDTSALVALDDIHRTSRVRFASVVLADTLGLFDDRLKLTLGGREQQILSTNYAAQTGVRTADYDQSRFSPALGAVLKMTERFSLYGNYVEALQQGPSAPSTTVNAGQVFAPIVARQLEIGLKVDFGNWFSSLGAFQIVLPSGTTDMQTMVFAVNGQQRNRGVEWAVSGQPVDHWRVLGGITLMDGRQTQTAGGLYDHNKAVGVPDCQANLGVEWDTPFPDLTVTTRALYTGRQFIDAANTQAIAAWTRYDLGARYALKGVMAKPILLRVAVENVANKDYWAAAASGQSAGISRGGPRTVLLSSTFSF